MAFTTPVFANRDSDLTSLQYSLYRSELITNFAITATFTPHVTPEEIFQFHFVKCF